MIYSFYVADNECNNLVYKLHYKMIERYSNIFDKIIMIIVYDGNYNDDIIYRIRSKIISICKCKDLKIIFEHNNHNYREGIIFKKYIIDKLESYDDYITFFGHTKGITNKDGLNNIDNLLRWIYCMYELNFTWINEVKEKLTTYSMTNDNKYISYGSLYFKDYRHNNVNNWFYSGSFFWLNTRKLYNHIKENNINILPFISEEGEKLKRCAELFIGSCIDSNHAGFHYDERYNKETNFFNIYGWEFSYKHIEELVKKYLNLWEYEKLNKNYNETINNLS